MKGKEMSETDKRIALVTAIQRAEEELGLSDLETALILKELAENRLAGRRKKSAGSANSSAITFRRTS